MDRLKCPFEVKFTPEQPEGSFSGYGAVFGNLDSYGDVIEPGAFQATLKEARKSGRWPAMLAQHGGFGMTAEDDMPIGVWTALEEDEIGLKVEGVLAGTGRAQDVYRLLKMQPRPALDGLSIGYRAKEWETGTKPDEPRRRLKKIDLIEVSIVTFPANDQARIGAVKGRGFELREFERLLVRDAGFSRSEALVVINQGFKALRAKRDAGDGLEQAIAAHRARLAELKPNP
jgi:hypothetical protein